MPRLQFPIQALLAAMRLMAAVMIAVLGAPCQAPAGEPATAAEPLVLEVALNFGGAEFRQEIVVAEEHEFRVVTHSDNLRWTVEGRLGRIVEGIAPVTLSYEAYSSPMANIRGLPGQLPLTVDDCGSGGWGGFRLMVQRLWLRRGIDPVPVLIRSLAARQKNYAVAVCRLGEFGPKAKPAVAELVGVLKDAAIDQERKPSETVRAAAADSLGKIGPVASDAVPALLQAVRDENPYLRLDASLALWRIAAHADAAPAAMKELESDNRFVRYRAVSTIRQMGPKAKAAVPALTAALADSDGYMRVEAAWALWAVDRNPAALACLNEISEHDADAEIRRFAASIRRAIEEEQPVDDSD